MAFFTKSLGERLLGMSRINGASFITTCRTSLPRTAVALNHQTAPSKLAPDPGDDGVFRRYIHRQSPTAAALGLLPTGEKLLEKLWGRDISKDRIRLDGLRPPSEETPDGMVTVADVRKVLRLTQMEKVKSRLRQIEKDWVPFPEFLEVCAKECSSLDLALEFAKILDESGSVIVLGNIVFLRPHQVVKAVQGLMPVPPSPKRSDPRMMEELQDLEKQKIAIDKQAAASVKQELWCGLGYLVIQTAGFVRLTFWELTWDVMEPICFYVTSVYFMLGYAFFLRTSKEPSFEGFFQSRFASKQRRLMKRLRFDNERYNELKRSCHPQSNGNGGS